MHLAQFFERVKAVAGLRVGHALACIDHIPEVRETVGKAVGPGHILRLEVAGAHEEGIRFLHSRLHEDRYVVGIVLAVGIQGQHI